MIDPRKGKLAGKSKKQEQEEIVKSGVPQAGRAYHLLLFSELWGRFIVCL
jgi:hypothetical protein